jgi:hypothetical protein
MLFAQSLGEYNAGGMVARVATSFESMAQWVQMSLRDEPAMWIGGAVCLAIVVWLVRRR